MQSGIFRNMKLNIDPDNWTRIIPAVTLVILFALFSVIVPAQETSPVYVDASQCRNITVDLVRVACYDSLADQALGQPPPATEPAGPVQTEASINRQLQEQNWQMRAELARIPQGDSPTNQTNGTQEQFGKPEQRIFESDDGDQELFDRIMGLQKAPDGWIVTLASGQVWRQMHTKRYDLHEGQEVKISPTRWGSSYRLSVKELGSFIQVERIR